MFNRAGIGYHLVTGYLEDPAAWRRSATGWKRPGWPGCMRDNRVGLLGHYYGGMLDVYSDLTQHVGRLRLPLRDAGDVRAARPARPGERRAGRGQAQAVRAAVRRCPRSAPEEELERAARTSLRAGRGWWQAHRLGSLAYYYEGEPGNDHENIVTSVIAGNTLLTAAHVPVAGEYEVKNVQAMKIMDAFGAGGSSPSST